MIEAAGVSTSLRILASLMVEFYWMIDEIPSEMIAIDAIAKSRY
jgi:hypothetical protein